jgi:hypothetical protein
MERSKAILRAEARPRDSAPGVPRRAEHTKGQPDARLRAALEALNELFEAFVVDNDQLGAWQAHAARRAANVLRPYWRELRRAARAARPVA